MEATLPQILAKCINGNQAYRCCCKADCQHPASICSQENCSCQNNHASCTISPKASNLKVNLETKGKSYLAVLQEIYTWYETQINLFTAEMVEIKKLIDAQAISLYGSEHLLYTYLKEGKSELIMPSLVAKVLALPPAQSYYPPAFLARLKKELQLYTQTQIKGVFNDIRYFAQSPLLLPISQNPVFSKELCHPGVEIINDYTIRAKQGGWIPALLAMNTSVNKFKALKYKFRLNKFTSHLMVGVIQMTENITVNNTNIYNIIEHGSIAYFNSNTIYLGKSVGHSRQNTNANGAASHNDIEVEYERVSEKVTVRNLNNNTQSVSYIKTRADLPLYIIFQLHTESDQVQLVGVSHTQ